MKTLCPSGPKKVAVVGKKANSSSYGKKNKKQGVTRTKLSRKEVGNHEVFIVQHVEIYEVTINGQTGYVHDGVPAYIASTLKSALKYIKDVQVSSFSWYVVTEFMVDGEPLEEGPILYYTRKGKQIEMQPIRDCIKAYKKAKKKDKFLQSMTI